MVSPDPEFKILTLRHHSAVFSYCGHISGDSPYYEVTMMSNTRSSEQGVQVLDEESLTLEIAKAIAAQRGVGLFKLTPLQEYTDLDALTALFESTNQTGHTVVSFRYEEYTVTVSGDGTVDVAPLTARETTNGEVAGK